MLLFNPLSVGGWKNTSNIFDMEQKSNARKY